MKKIIKRISSTEDLNSKWDSLADCYFQKKEFLTHIHKYNPAVSVITNFTAMVICLLQLLLTHLK
ncbi:MAG: hypothetical protein IPH77_10680 [Ignavibacteria bacterium]|nr:hypothetical protein [Ignavibacteria bacterium]